MIVDADACVLVGLKVSAFGGFDWVRIGLLDPTPVRRVQRIHLVEIVRLDCLLVRQNYIYGRRLVVLFRRGARSASSQHKKDQNRRREMHPGSSLHVGLSGQAH
jgi:hypothetical protein